MHVSVLLAAVLVVAAHGATSHTSWRKPTPSVTTIHLGADESLKERKTSEEQDGGHSEGKQEKRDREDADETTMSTTLFLPISSGYYLQDNTGIRNQDASDNTRRSEPKRLSVAIIDGEGVRVRANDKVSKRALKATTSQSYATLTSGTEVFVGTYRGSSTQRGASPDGTTTTISSKAVKHKVRFSIGKMRGTKKRPGSIKYESSVADDLSPGVGVSNNKLHLGTGGVANRLFPDLGMDEPIDVLNKTFELKGDNTTSTTSQGSASTAALLAEVKDTSVATQLPKAYYKMANSSSIVVDLGKDIKKSRPKLQTVSIPPQESVGKDYDSSGKHIWHSRVRRTTSSSSLKSTISRNSTVVSLVDKVTSKNSKKTVDSASVKGGVPALTSYPLLPNEYRDLDNEADETIKAALGNETDPKEVLANVTYEIRVQNPSSTTKKEDFSSIDLSTSVTTVSNGSRKQSGNREERDSPAAADKGGKNSSDGRNFEEKSTQDVGSRMQLTTLRAGMAAQLPAKFVNAPRTSLSPKTVSYWVDTMTLDAVTVPVPLDSAFNITESKASDIQNLLKVSALVDGLPTETKAQNYKGLSEMSFNASSFFNGELKLSKASKYANIINYNDSIIQSKSTFGLDSVTDVEFRSTVAISMPSKPSTNSKSGENSVDSSAPFIVRGKLTNELLKQTKMAFGLAKMTGKDKNNSRTSDAFVPTSSTSLNIRKTSAETIAKATQKKGTDFLTLLKNAFGFQNMGITERTPVSVDVSTNAYDYAKLRETVPASGNKVAQQNISLKSQTKTLSEIVNDDEKYSRSDVTTSRTYLGGEEEYSKALTPPSNSLLMAELSNAITDNQSSASNNPASPYENQTESLWSAANGSTQLSTLPFYEHETSTNALLSLTRSLSLQRSISHPASHENSDEISTNRSESIETNSSPLIRNIGKRVVVYAPGPGCSPETIDMISSLLGHNKTLNHKSADNIVLEMDCSDQVEQRPQDAAPRKIVTNVPAAHNDLSSSANEKYGASFIHVKTGSNSFAQDPGGGNVPDLEWESKVDSGCLKMGCRKEAPQLVTGKDSRLKSGQNENVTHLIGNGSMLPNSTPYPTIKVALHVRRSKSRNATASELQENAIKQVYVKLDKKDRERGDIPEAMETSREERIGENTGNKDCDNICKTKSRAVCAKVGTNIRTFESLCELRVAGCSTGEETKILWRGPCFKYRKVKRTVIEEEEVYEYVPANGLWATNTTALPGVLSITVDDLGKEVVQ